MKKTDYIRMFPEDIPPKSAREKKRRKNEIIEAAALIGAFFGIAVIWMIAAEAIRGVL